MPQVKVSPTSLFNRFLQSPSLYSYSASLTGTELALIQVPSSHLPSGQVCSASSATGSEGQCHGLKVLSTELTRRSILEITRKDDQ